MSNIGKPTYREDSARGETCGSDKVVGETGTTLARAVDIAYRKWCERRGLDPDMGFRKRGPFGNAHQNAGGEK